MGIFPVICYVFCVYCCAVQILWRIVCVANARTILSAGKCKSSNVCLLRFAVVQLFETPSCKREGHGFDS